MPHRKIWERYHGVKRRFNWDVHHIDGDHSNNDIRNLTLISKRGHAKRHIEMGQPWAANLISKGTGADISGENHPFYGKIGPRSGSTNTEEHNDKISDYMKSHIRSKEHCVNISKSKSGHNNPQHDLSVYQFNHEAHGDRLCTRYELIKEFGLNPSGVSLILNGKRPRTHGWSMIGK